MTSAKERARDAEHAAGPPVRERQPRRDRTRVALVHAGQKLFSERPVDLVSIDDIVQAADVAKGTFYNHFIDKDEFEREILAEARRELETAIQITFGNETELATRMALAICVSIRFAHDHPSRARLIVRQVVGSSQLHSELNAGMLQDVGNGIISGRFTLPTTEVGALTILGLGNIAIVRALELPEILAKVTLGQQMANVLLRAFGLHQDEAAQIAARAAEAVIRSGGAAPPASPHCETE